MRCCLSTGENPGQRIGNRLSSSAMAFSSYSTKARYRRCAPACETLQCRAIALKQASVALEQPGRVSSRSAEMRGGSTVYETSKGGYVSANSVTTCLAPARHKLCARARIPVMHPNSLGNNKTRNLTLYTEPVLYGTNRPVVARLECGSHLKPEGLEYSRQR